MNRRASRTVGTANTASMVLTATTTVITMPRSICAKSACRASRFSSRRATLAAGSDSLTAVTSRKWCPSQPVTSQATTESVQVRACAPVPMLGPANDAGMAWKAIDPAP
jgi:hypothetical protein